MIVTVLADDLSGANTTAALFHKRGWAATVHLGRDVAPTMDEHLTSIMSEHDESLTSITPYDEQNCVSEVHVWNAGTRNESDAAAAAIFREMALSLGCDGGVVAYRIDSTLRGPIVASLDALLSAWPNHIAVVAPAYPDSGRTTKEAIHYVNGMPVHETPVGADKFAPVSTSDLRELIGKRSCHPFVHLPLERLRGTEEELLQFLGDAAGQGARVILSDAVTNMDIFRLAEAVVRLQSQGQRFIPVDSGPFTAAFATLIAASSENVNPVVFGISASMMHHAKAQMDYLEHTVGLPMIHYTGQSVSQVIEEMKQVVRAYHGKRAGFPIVQGSTLFLRTDTWQLDTSSAATAVERLPEIVSAVIQEFPSLKGFYLSGGEAAATILSGLGVSMLEMEMEVAPLTTMSRPLDGLLSGAYIVTKGGAIGDEKAVLEALVKLHEVIGRAGRKPLK